MHEIAGVQMDLLLHDMYVHKLKEGIVSGASSVWRESMVLFAKADFVSGGCFQAPLSLTPKLNNILQSLHLLDDIHFNASPPR